MTPTVLPSIPLSNIDYEKIGEYLFRARKNLRLNVSNVSQIAGCAHRTLTSLEQDPREDLTLGAFVKLCLAVGVSPSELLDHVISFGYLRPDGSLTEQLSARYCLITDCSNPVIIRRMESVIDRLVCLALRQLWGRNPARSIERVCFPSPEMRERAVSFSSGLSALSNCERFTLCNALRDRPVSTLALIGLLPSPSEMRLLLQNTCGVTFNLAHPDGLQAVDTDFYAHWENTRPAYASKSEEPESVSGSEAEPVEANAV